MDHAPPRPTSRQPGDGAEVRALGGRRDTRPVRVVVTLVPGDRHRRQRLADILLAASARHFAAMDRETDPDNAALIEVPK